MLAEVLEKPLNIDGKELCFGLWLLFEYRLTKRSKGKISAGGKVTPGGLTSILASKTAIKHCQRICFKLQRSLILDKYTSVRSHQRIRDPPARQKFVDPGAWQFG